MRARRIAVALVVGGLLSGLTSMSASAAPMAAVVNVQQAQVAAAVEPGKFPDGRRYKYSPTWTQVKGYKPGTGGGVDLPNVRWDTECTASMRWYVEEPAAGDGTDAGAGAQGSGYWKIQISRGKCDKGGGKELVGGGGKEWKSEYVLLGKRYQTGKTPTACMITTMGLADQGDAAETSTIFRTKWTFDGEISNGTACTPETILVSVYRRDAGSDDTWQNQFETVEFDVTKLGKPLEIAKQAPTEVPTGVCDFGAPVTVTLDMNRLFDGLFQVRLLVTANPGFTGRWVFSGSVNVAGVPEPQTLNGYTATLTGQTQYVTGSSSVSVPNGTTASQITLRGAQVTRYATGSTSEFMPNRNGKKYEIGTGPGKPQSASGFGDGWTFPEACSFYIGQKIVDDGAPGIGPDEPFTGSQTPPTPPWESNEDEPAPEAPDKPSDDDACTFKWTDPTTWLEGGLCALVSIGMRLLGLLDTLVTLISALPKWFILLLATAVTGWFIFRNDYVSGQNDRLKDDWSNTGPGKAIDEFGAIAAQQKSVSGCAGPTIPVNTPYYKATWTPLDSCSGPRATVAAVSRSALSASAYLGALITFVRLVGASIGLNINSLGRRD